MKTIRHVETLDRYDGPILFVGKDDVGVLYLAVAVKDNVGDELLYAVVAVPPEDLRRFRSGLVDLRALMLEAGADVWFLASFSGDEGGFDLQPQSTPLAQSRHLPGLGYTLDPGE